MIWLVKLYPPAWQRRYGRELAELIASQPASLGTAIDLVAGAIDAWLRPQSSTAAHAAAHAKGDATMLAKMMQLRCAGHAPTITSADVAKSVVVTLGGTLVLTFLWVWASQRYDDNPYLEFTGSAAFLVPTLAGLRYTSLKGRPTSVQAVFVFGMTAIVLSILLTAAWLNS